MRPAARAAVSYYGFASEEVFCAFALVCSVNVRNQVAAVGLTLCPAYHNWCDQSGLPVYRQQFQRIFTLRGFRAAHLPISNVCSAFKVQLSNLWLRCVTQEFVFARKIP